MRVIARPGMSGAGAFRLSDWSLPRLTRAAMATLMSANLVFGTSVVSMEPAKAVTHPAGESAATVLPNGLRVILLEERAFPMVSCQMWYHVGSVDDPAGASGLCHVVEHVLTNAIRKNGGRLAKELVCVGGKFDAFTSDDFTVFVENVSSKHLDLALSLQLNRIHPPAITESDVERARQEVLKEVEGMSQPNELALNREVRGLAFSRHPYKNLPGGFVDEIKHVTLHSVSHFMKSHFNPANATLVLTGDFDHARTLGLIKMKFAHVTSGGAKPHENLPVEPRQMGEKRVYINSSGNRTHLFVAFRGPQASDNDAPGTTVLESLLGDDTDGLLKEVFVDSNLCDRAVAAFELRKHPGVITVNLRGKAGVTEARLLAGLDQLCERITRGTFENDQLEGAKNRAIFRCSKNRSGPYGMAFQLGFFDSLCKTDESKRWITKLSTVDRGNVLQVANKYLQKSNRSLGFLIAKPVPTPPSPPAKTSAVKQPIGYTSRAIRDRPFFSPMSCASFSGDMVEMVPTVDESRNSSTRVTGEGLPDVSTSEDLGFASYQVMSDVGNPSNEPILLAKADDSELEGKPKKGTADSKSSTPKKPASAETQAKDKTASKATSAKTTTGQTADKNKVSKSGSAQASRPVAKPTAGNQPVAKDNKTANQQASPQKAATAKPPTGSATSPLQGKAGEKTASGGASTAAGKPVTAQPKASSAQNGTQTAATHQKPAAKPTTATSATASGPAKPAATTAKANPAQSGTSTSAKPATESATGSIQSKPFGSNDNNVTQPNTIGSQTSGGSMESKVGELSRLSTATTTPKTPAAQSTTQSASVTGSPSAPAGVNQMPVSSSGSLPTTAGATASAVSSVSKPASNTATSSQPSSGSQPNSKPSTN
ncbi:MAG: insulinase family protein, partial [Cyanobacteria bacterium]|nr:insulinase family protein [Cyanobacteriota bacterium]